MPRYKHQLLDKHDAHIPGKESFVHAEFYVSGHSEQFHLSSAYVYEHNRRGGQRMGVNKRAYKVSPYGICVDGHYIGKGEN